MSALSIVRSAFGAALAVNAVPHGVSAVLRRPFPSPFADPPGVGMSPPVVNLGWSLGNATVGFLLLRRGVGTPGEWIAASVAGVGMAAVLVFHFGSVLKGGTGLRGLRDQESR